MTSPISIRSAVLAGARGALRHIRTTPLESGALIATLAMSLGATVAIVGISNVTLGGLREGLTRPQELHWLLNVDEDNETNAISFKDFEDYRSSLIANGLAAYKWATFAFGADAMRDVAGSFVTADYFRVLGSPIPKGRGFSAEEERGRIPVTVLSHSLWLSLGADNKILGSQVTLNGYAFEVIGVAAPQFEGLNVTSPEYLWVPVGTMDFLEPDSRGVLERRGDWQFSVFFRAKEESLKEAASAFETIAQGLRAEFPLSHQRFLTVRTLPMLGIVHPEERGWLLPVFRVSTLTSSLVLLGTCLNFAVLAAIRNLAKVPERALRRAFGASSADLLLQAMSESLIFFFLAALGGLFVAPAMVSLLLALAHWPFPLVVHPGAAGMAVTGTIAAVALGLVSGSLSALAVPVGEMRLLVRGVHVLSSKRGGARVVSLLCTAQLSVLVVLLVCLSGSVHTLRNASRTSAEIGQATQLVVIPIDLRRRVTDYAGKMSVPDALSRHLASLPGVRGVTVTSDPLLIGTPRRSFVVGNDSVLASIVYVDWAYFGVTGTSILSGRAFTSGDAVGSPAVSILSQDLQALLWPSSAAEQHVTIPGSEALVTNVVGVAATRPFGAQHPAPAIYLPWIQHPEAVSSLSLLVNVESPDVVPMLRHSIQRNFEELGSRAVGTIESFYRASYRRPRAVAALLLTISTMALVVTALGVYALVASWLVTFRHELAIRRALGASSWRIARGLLRQTGFAIGASLFLAFLLGHLLTAFLPEFASLTSPLLPNLATAAFLVLFVCLAAVAGPMAAASRIEATEILSRGQ